MASPASEVALGFDLGGTKLRAVLTRPDGTVLVERTVPTVHDATALVADMVGLADRLREDVVPTIPAPRLVSAGIGAPGLVDRSGTLRYGANLAGVVDAPFAALLTEALGVPVAADNDATCAAWAEHRIGAARGRRHAVVITLGTGIGGGVVVDGRLVRGADGFAGEPGHMMVDPSGPRCPCGRRGCWERFGSGTALGRFGREAARDGRADAILAAAGGDVDAITGEHVTVAALTGDPTGLELLDTLAWWVAAGIANLIDLLDPEIVVVSGGLVDAGDVLMEPARRHVTEQLYGASVRPVVPVVAAELGSDAGAVGAALLGLDRLPDGSDQA